MAMINFLPSIYRRIYNKDAQQELNNIDEQHQKQIAERKENLDEALHVLQADYEERKKEIERDIEIWRGFKKAELSGLNTEIDAAKANLTKINLDTQKAIKEQEDRIKNLKAQIDLECEKATSEQTIRIENLKMEKERIEIELQGEINKSVEEISKLKTNAYNKKEELNNIIRETEKEITSKKKEINLDNPKVMPSEPSAKFSSGSLGDYLILQKNKNNVDAKKAIASLLEGNDFSYFTESAEKVINDIYIYHFFRHDGCYFQQILNCPSTTLNNLCFILKDDKCYDSQMTEILRVIYQKYEDKETLIREEDVDTVFEKCKYCPSQFIKFILNAIDKKQANEKILLEVIPKILPLNSDNLGYECLYQVKKIASYEGSTEKVFNALIPKFHTQGVIEAMLGNPNFTKNNMLTLAEYTDGCISLMMKHKHFDIEVAGVLKRNKAVEAFWSELDGYIRDAKDGIIRDELGIKGYNAKSEPQAENSLRRLKQIKQIEKDLKRLKQKTQEATQNPSDNVTLNDLCKTFKNMRENNNPKYLLEQQLGRIYDEYKKDATRFQKADADMIFSAYEYLNIPDNMVNGFLSLAIDKKQISKEVATVYKENRDIKRNMTK